MFIVCVSDKTNDWGINGYEKFLGRKLGSLSTFELENASPLPHHVETSIGITSILDFFIWSSNNDQIESNYKALLPRKGIKDKHSIDRSPASVLSNYFILYNSGTIAGPIADMHKD